MIRDSTASSPASVSGALRQVEDEVSPPQCPVSPLPIETPDLTYKVLYSLSWSGQLAAL